MQTTYFDENSDNPHNKSIILGVAEKITVLEALHGQHLLEQGINFETNLFNTLIDVLSDTYDGNRGTMLSGRLVFIENLFKARESLISYSQQPIPESVILFYVVHRIISTNNINAKNNFRRNIDHCYEWSDGRYVLICANGRVTRYLDALVLCDNDPTLAAPFNDPAEKRYYVMTKIHTLFMKSLRDYPDYLLAYEGKQQDPSDYNIVIQKIISDVLDQVKDELPDDINMQEFIRTFI